MCYEIVMPRIGIYMCIVRTICNVLPNNLPGYNMKYHCSICRIINSRKVLGHQNLVMGCVDQLVCMFKVNSCI
ncbi:hypothetical protein C5167_030691 [Papaver somniferum]|nr:hypothetical protein C5167_030691 [Papaver somniferum]